MGYACNKTEVGGKTKVQLVTYKDAEAFGLPKLEILSMKS